MIHALMRGGWVMIPLLCCSLVALTVVIERFIFFARIRAQDRAEQMLALVRVGRREEAISLAAKTRAPLVRTMAAGVADRREPSKAMEVAGLAEVAAMRRGLVALDTIITISPLLGLLGTIIGMMGSFQIMAASGLGQPHAVTGGVAEALIATATGIAIAVTALIPFNYFQGRIEQETETIEQYSLRLEMALCAFPKG